MEALIVIAAVVGVVGAMSAAAVAVTWWRWRGIVRRRVMLVVLGADGELTVSAILWRRRGGLLILRDAAVYLRGGDAPKHVDGEMVIERARVVWVQVLP